MGKSLNNDFFWYKDAIFYEIYIRSFYDSNANGIGDFRGLTEKLDYLEWLGIDCICISPIYASPQRNDVHDTLDYYDIPPEYGTLEDFERFMDAAHKRGIRAIADLMLNHTCDNPLVQEEILYVISFWMELGIDGFRLGATPYLDGRDNTNYETWPDAPAFHRQLRSFVDECYPGRILLNDSNQWPEDAVAHLGNSDGFHISYQFLIASRLLIALQQEDHGPIVEILDRTLAIPNNFWWGIQFRNHDELTQKKRVDEKRDYQYQKYANDQGLPYKPSIRRRLAPLMENGRRRIELMHGLLLSLPGSPFLYYGDEIGMGDNIYLGDRDGVRTPMQWSADRNAGFSKADFAELYLPIIIDPVYGYEMVNVEAQMHLPISLLNWVRLAISLRKQHPAFGRGSFGFIKSDNRKIFAFMRTYRDETIICVYNLSRSSQPFKLDLSHYERYVPIEMFGQARFPRVESKPYQLSLNEYGFFWLLVHKDGTKSQC
jgi:maltose alpha-D-glucosyltransferase / alpha-amylase